MNGGVTILALELPVILGIVFSGVLLLVALPVPFLVSVMLKWVFFYWKSQCRAVRWYLAHPGRIGVLLDTTLALIAVAVSCLTVDYILRAVSATGLIPETPLSVGMWLAALHAPAVLMIGYLIARNRNKEQEYIRWRFELDSESRQASQAFFSAVVTNSGQDHVAHGRSPNPRTDRRHVKHCMTDGKTQAARTAPVTYMASTDRLRHANLRLFDDARSSAGSDWDAEDLCGTVR